jgi:hypothetical protein
MDDGSSSRLRRLLGQLTDSTLCECLMRLSETSRFSAVLNRLMKLIEPGAAHDGWRRCAFWLGATVVLKVLAAVAIGLEKTLDQ